MSKVFSNIIKLINENEKSSNIETLIKTLNEHEVNKTFNFCNDRSTTLLIWATMVNNNNIVELLLNMENINVNFKNDRGYTALIWASMKGINKEIVELLLSRSDIDVNIKIMNRGTALNIASLNNHEEIVKMLLRKKT